LLDEISTIGLLKTAVVVATAYVVRGVAGFGSGLVAIPFLALMLPVTTAVPMVVFLDYVASASQGVKSRSEIQWREILPLLPFALLGVLTALYLFNTVDTGLLSKGLGGFILLYAVYSLLARATQGLGSRLWAIPAGSFGGLIGTLFGTGGPFYVLFLKHRGLGKTQFRATFATIFLLDGAGRLTGYLFAGLYSMDLLLILAVTLPIMFAGLYVGSNIHTALSQKAFQTAISILLLISGTSLVLK
jgi:uncharacterized membrane protein YfcA